MDVANNVTLSNRARHLYTVRMYANGVALR